MNYLTLIRNLPIPTIEQIERFKLHLLYKHSWYKRLSLKEGNTFVIYLEPNLNRTYSNDFQMFPFDVNSKKDYFNTYGHLSYAWEESGNWNQDCGESMSKIPYDLMKKWSLTLFPYCHNDFEEAISILKKTLDNKNEQIPNYIDLLELENKIQLRNNYWNENLTDEDREIIYTLDDNLGYMNLKEPTNFITKYLKIESEVNFILDKLKSREIIKIDKIIQIVVEDLKKIKLTPVNT